MENRTLGIYPHLNNTQFQKKITLKKEFRYKYDDTLEPVSEKADILCKKTKDFELAPHQEFVRRFISIDNPYNGILLYHGLGSGKTCSAISITESLRSYSSFIPNFKKIMIVASPNVQENFKLQLFDKNKLTNENGIWNLTGCVGNALLQELYKFDINRLSKEDLIQKIEKIIKDNYKFIGYIGLANYIQKMVDKNEIKQLRYNFEGRIIVIDEIHNIRLQGDSESKLVAKNLSDLVKFVKGIKLICLTGTPMYNDPREIVFLLNLMNLNDKRPPIKIEDIFDKNGEIINNDKLIQSANGYISYVRGENPYVFPYMITPKMYDDPNKLTLTDYPKFQFNGKDITQPIKHLDLYKTKLSDLQEEAYNYIIQKIIDQYEEKGKMEHFEYMDSLRYEELMKPIQSLNICFPTDNPREPFSFGKEGLSKAMRFNSNKSNYEYLSGPLKGMFTYENIGIYSSKIKSILEHIINSKGIVLVYSQYLPGGLIPIALALEELGFKRYGDDKKSLFKTGAKINNEKLNVYNLPGFNESERSKNSQACYSIISGDKGISPDNNEEIEALTNNNLNGNRVKVVLISQAGTEGIDLKNLRQVHILEPWYNLNRVEQIIGRARRNCSHSQLDLKDRNFQLFMHVTELNDNEIEPLDMFLYRNAEKKSIKIGKVTRILKSVSIDCLLNMGQQKFSNADEELDIVTSEGKKIKYSIRDKPFSSLCDYMENCSYSCINEVTPEEEKNKINSTTYKYKFTKNNGLIDKIKDLYLKRHVYTKREIMHLLKKNKNITKQEIDRALYDLIEDRIPIVDRFFKLGIIINISDLFLFQPIESNDKRLLMYDRQVPITSKVTEIPLTLKRNSIERGDREIQERAEVKKNKKQRSESKGAEERVVEERYENNNEIENENNGKSKESRNNNNNSIPKTLQLVKERYDECIQENEYDKDSISWYKIFFKVRDELREKGFDISDEDLNKYALRHICEVLVKSQEIELLNYLSTKEDNLNDFERMLYDYYETLMIEQTVDDITYNGIFLVNIIGKDGAKEELYVKDPITNKWKPASYSEFNMFFKPDKSGKVNLKQIYLKGLKYNKSVGFIGVLKGIFEFKEKEIREGLRASKGASVYSKSKELINKFINNDILNGDNVFTKENTNKKDKLLLTIIAEILMRYFDETDGNKRFFLNKFEMTLHNDNSK
jgi:superfamily II DNA or RNA helicase